MTRIASVQAGFRPLQPLLLSLFAACNSTDPPMAGDGTTATDGDGDGDGDGNGNCPDPAGMPAQDALEHIGRGEWSGSGNFIEILDVLADGTYVYACTGTQGMMIWDATGDGSPRLGAEKIGGPFAHSAYPRCQHLGADFANGKIVITSRGDEIQPTPFLYLFDISNPASPQGIGGWQGPESIEGVVLHEGRIYAAAHRDGIMVFDAESGSSLNELARVSDADSDAWQPLIHDGRLIVAEGSAGLRVYDISANTPALLSSIPLRGSSHDVVVSNNIAYVASSTHINIVDLVDPENPTLISETATTSAALALAVGQNDTLVVAEWDEARTYDISNLSSPRLIDAERVPTTSSFSRVLNVDAVPTPNGDSGRVYLAEWEGMHAYQQHDCGYGPDVAISPLSLQFGSLEAGETEDRVLVVRNEGNQTLHVTDISSNGPQLSINSDGFELPPAKPRRSRSRSPRTADRSSTRKSQSRAMMRTKRTASCLPAQMSRELGSTIRYQSSAWSTSTERPGQRPISTGKLHFSRTSPLSDLSVVWSFQTLSTSFGKCTIAIISSSSV